MEMQDLGYHFKRVNECFRKNGDARVKKYGLTKPQMDILFYLLHSKDKTVTQREIEKHFNLKHSTVIGILKRMESHGFIIIKVSETDRRQRNIYPTDKALILKKDCIALKKETETRFKSKLSEKDYAELLRLLDLVYNIFQEESK